MCACVCAKEKTSTVQRIFEREALNADTDALGMAWLSSDVVCYIGVSILIAWIIKQLQSSFKRSHVPRPVS